MPVLLQRWETCIAAGRRVKLPQDLCEHSAIFHEFLDYQRIWQESLSDAQKESLVQYLPKTTSDGNVEQQLEETLRMFFQGENERFGIAPLDSFCNHLTAGHYRPDIRRMRTLVRKAQKRRLLFEERKRSYELAGHLLKSRESLLLNAYRQGFSHPTQRTSSKLHWRKPKPAMGKHYLSFSLEMLPINIGFTLFLL